MSRDSSAYDWCLESANTPVRPVSHASLSRRESWRDRTWAHNRSHRTFSPPASGFLAQQIVRSSRSFSTFRLHWQCVRPSPADRLTTRTRWARPWIRKENTMAIIGIFTTSKDGASCS